MTDVFNKTLREALKAKGMLTDDAGKAQASFKIWLIYKRTFYVFTNRRARPEMHYVIKGYKGNNLMVNFKSEQLARTWGWFNRETDADELALIRLLAHRVVWKIVALEQQPPSANN